MPPRHKQAIVVWLAIYPMITVILAVGGSSLEPLPLPVRTLVLTLVLVPLMTFVLVPALNHLLRGWLLSPPPDLQTGPERAPVGPPR
jgi:antibiotic biosynthesis monooxygenase (ABM) superfamily enzyme